MLTLQYTFSFNVLVNAIAILVLGTYEHSADLKAISVAICE